MQNILRQIIKNILIVQNFTPIYVTELQAWFFWPGSQKGRILGSERRVTTELRDVAHIACMLRRKYLYGH